MGQAETVANHLVGVYLWADDTPPEVVLDQALTTLKEAHLSPEEEDEAVLYLAARLAEKL